MLFDVRHRQTSAIVVLKLLSTKALCGFIYNMPCWKSIVSLHSNATPGSNLSLQQTSCYKLLTLKLFDFPKDKHGSYVY